MRQPINKTSRVPAYVKALKVDGFCDFQVKFFHIGKDLG